VPGCIESGENTAPKNGGGQEVADNHLNDLAIFGPFAVRVSWSSREISPACRFSRVFTSPTDVAFFCKRTFV